MIKKEGRLQVFEGGTNAGELDGCVASLVPGNYRFLIYDDKKNRLLPRLKYLNGIVLKTVSDNLPGRPPIDALYRYFERMFAPVHTCYLDDRAFEYQNLKREKEAVINDIIARIVRYVREEWGIGVVERSCLATPEAREAYLGAYTDTWQDSDLINLINSHQTK